MTRGLLVGIDVGTSSGKAVVLDPDGAELATSSHPLRWAPVDGGAELDAMSVLRTVQRVVADALQRAPYGQVLAAGVASMADAGFALDPAGEALAPAMAWHDERAAGELAALHEELPGFVEVTGLRPNARPAAVRHRWRLRSESYARRPTRWLSVAEYVVHALGGDQVAEPSLASRTGWLDVAGLRWWPPALAWSGAPPALLPELRPAGAAAGRATTGGPLAGATLTVAGHDHLSAAVGAGALDPSPIVDSCGTAEVLLRAVPPHPTPAMRTRAVAAGFTLGRHVLPGLHAAIGGFPSGQLLRRLASALGLDDPQLADAVVRQQDQTQPGDDPGSLVDAPSDRDRATGSVHPLGIDALDQLIRDVETAPARSPADAARCWRAAIESIAVHAGGVLVRLESLTGERHVVLTVGGSTHGSLLAQARSRHLGELLRPRVREAAARGAALAAGVAHGLYDGLTAVPVPALDLAEEHVT